MPPTPELAILRFLARRTHATASAIGAACGMGPGVARAHLAALEGMRLVAGRPDPGGPAGRSRRVYAVAAEGRRAAEIGIARATAGA